MPTCSAAKAACAAPTASSSGRWTKLTTGAPILDNAIGALDCALEDTVERFDTIIAIGRLVDFTGRDDGEPLLFFRGGYR